MSLEFYKILHILGLTLVVLSLGGIVAVVANGGTKQSNALRKATAISHGVGLIRDAGKAWDYGLAAYLGNW